MKKIRLKDFFSSNLPINGFLINIGLTTFIIFILLSLQNIISINPTSLWKLNIFVGTYLLICFIAYKEILIEDAYIQGGFILAEIMIMLFILKGYLSILS